MHLRRGTGPRRHRQGPRWQVTDLDTLKLLLTRAEKAEQQRDACIGAMKESLASSGYSPGNAHPAEKVLAATLALVVPEDFAGRVHAAFGGMP